LVIRTQRPEATGPRVAAGPNGAVLDFTYTRRKTAPGEATFTVEWSDTLAPGSWSNAGVTEEILNSNATLQTVKASMPVPGADQRFIRLRVTKP
jgi:hypothetical protein